MGFKSYIKGEQKAPSEFKKILPFISIIILIFGMAHYFIYLISSRSFDSSNLKSTYLTVLFIGLVSIPTGFFISHSKRYELTFLIWTGYIWMGLFNFLFFFSLVELLVDSFFFHNYSYWVIYASAAIGIFSLFKGLSDPVVIKHKIKNKMLNGLRLVQISDLHIGMLHLNEKWLARVVEQIKPLAPDIIAITGDLVEGEYNENHHKLDVLKNLPQESKKYYITGNHEYIHGAGPWDKKLSEFGFTTLHNQNEIIEYKNSKILIAGVPDRMIGRFIKGLKSIPDLALKTSEKTDYRILLVHQPASVFDLVTETCDLVLSGHTHGGQIFPFHLLVRLAHPLLSGFKTINGIKVFAHQGTGLWGPPMRWFSRSEIVLIEWE